jgi:hypothetical protein
MSIDGTELNVLAAFLPLTGRSLTGLRERSQTPGCFFGDLLVLGAERALEGVSCSGDVTLVCQQAPEAERCGCRHLWVRRIDRALVGVSCGYHIAVAF